MSNRTRWILSVSGGVLAALPWWGLPVTLLLICFVPLLFIEDDIQNSKEPVLSLLPFSFIFFFSWNLTVCWWIARIHLLGGMSVIILNALLMSLVFLLYSRIKRSAGGGVVVFVILWIGFEFLHYRGDLSWPWLSLGNGLAGNIRLIQWYEFTGTTGGSLWILLVNVTLFSVINNFSLKLRTRADYWLAAILIFLVAFPVVASLTIFNSYSEMSHLKNFYEHGQGNPERPCGNGNSISKYENCAGTGFLILQPGLDPYSNKYSSVSNSQRLDHLFSLIVNNIEEGTRYIVSPETSVDSIWITDPCDNLSKRVHSFLEQYPGTGLVLGATAFSSVHRKGKSFTTRRDEQGNYYDIYNSALFYYDGSPLLAYHKHYLANGVEQIPFQSVFRFLGRFSLDLGGVSGSLKRGEGPQVFTSPLPDSLVIAPLICFESAYGEYAARMVSKGAEILVVISNDGWFKDTGAYRQHLRLSQIRAIENRRSVVRAANTGISAHISPKGEIIDELGWWEEGALPVRVNRNERITFFSVYGDFTGRIAMFFSSLMVLNLFVSLILKATGRK